MPCHPAELGQNAVVITARPIDERKRVWFLGSLIGPREYLSARGRAAWFVVGLCCAVVLGVGAWLRPDARGFGTHEGLGMPPCSFVLNSGLPCPTCGMTTAYSFLLHGHPASAFMAQPAGFAMCLATVVMMFVSFRAAARGYMVHPNWHRLGPVRVMMAVGLLLVGGWGFKIAHGLMTGALPVRY